MEAERVRELARLLGAPFFLRKVEVFNSKARGFRGSGAPGAATAALGEIARLAGTPVVATAHTRRDQAETLLLRLIRGAGPGALAGVRRRRTLMAGIELARPLLDVLGRPRGVLPAHWKGGEDRAVHVVFEHRPVNRSLTVDRSGQVCRRASCCRF